MKKIKSISYLFAFFLLLISCSTENKNTWLAYKLELPALDDADELVVVKFSDNNKKFKLHWFIYYEGYINDELQRSFTRMTWEGHTRTVDDKFQLLPQLTFNMIKYSTGNIRRFPIGRPPEFNFIPKTETLELKPGTCTKLSSKSGNEVLELITIQLLWYNEPFDLFKN